MLRSLHMLTGWIVLAAVLAVGIPIGWQYAQSRVESRAYQYRLNQLAAEYETLAEQYNRAIARTAVTELQVRDGQLDVVIRCATGELRRIATPFDPSGEIYVDYILRDGRLWIRRVFDGQTAPRNAVVIDPELAHLNWQADGQNQNYGKAVYRSLTEGRWIITVTGDGSLGLRQAHPTEIVELLPAPKLGNFPLAQESTHAHTRPLTHSDYLQALPPSKSD